MKKNILALLCCSLIMSFAQAANLEPLDKIAAVVNDDVITQSELTLAIHNTRAELSQEHAPLPSKTELRKQVLNQLINKKLQLQMAKQMNLSTSNQEVDKAIARIAEQNHITTQALYHRVTLEGLKIADYRHNIQDQITLQKLQQHEVVGQINVTQQEISQLVRAPIWQNNGPKEYDIKDILLPLADNPSQDQINSARTAALDILKGLQAGKSLDKLAAQYHIKVENTDLGWRKLDEIPSIFANTVLHMPNRSIAGPVQAANGFHIIALAGTRVTNDHEIAPTTEQARQILLQRKFEEAVQNWVSKLRGQAFILTDLEK